MACMVSGPLRFTDCALVHIQYIPIRKYSVYHETYVLLSIVPFSQIQSHIIYLH